MAENSKEGLIDYLTKPFHEAVDTLQDKKRKPVASQSIDYSDQPIDIEGRAPVEKPPRQSGNPDDRTFVGPHKPAPTLMDGLRETLTDAGDAIEAGATAVGDTISSGVEAFQEFTEDKPNFWVGAAPLLMGALLGDIGEGARHGSAGLMQRYKDERDRDLAATKARKTAADTKMQAKKVINPVTGQEEWYNYNPVTGEFQGAVGSPIAARSKEELTSIKEESDIRMGKHLKETTGPQGSKMVFDKVNRTHRAIYPEERFTPKQQTHIGKVRTALNKETEKQLDSYRRLSGSLKSFKEGSVLGAKTALKEYAKHVEGGQRLSDFDVEFLNYSFGQRKKAEEWAEEFKTGNMVERLQTELGGSVARGLEEAKNSIIRKYSNAYRSGSELGLRPEEMREILGAPEGLFNKAYIEHNGKTYPVNMKDLRGVLNQPRYREARIIRYE